mgnify:CR=1 FL=1
MIERGERAAECFRKSRFKLDRCVEAFETKGVRVEGGERGECGLRCFKEGEVGRVDEIGSERS